MTKIKILTVTDSPRIHTGLGENCRLMFKDLLARYPDKYEVESLGWFNFSNSEPISWPVHSTNTVQQPNGTHAFDAEDRYGQRTFEGVLAKFKPDIVWAAGDMWCFEHLIHSPNRNSFRLSLYYTIDGAPYFGTWLNPDHSSEWGSKLCKADEVVVWSEFGEKVLKESCPELRNRDISVIYHPTDVSRFRYLNPEQKKKERQRLYSGHVPTDAFVLGFIGRNQFRKQNYKIWEVMHYIKHGDYIECKDCDRITIKEYNWNNQTVKTGPTYRYEASYNYDCCWYCRSKNITEGQARPDIYLWQHMPKTDPAYNFDLHAKMWKIQDKVICTGIENQGKGIPAQQLAELMSTWDGFVYLSGGEGFGIPAFEAQMCGLPVIYSNYSSHADFAQYGGLPVRCDFIPEFAFAINRAIADTGDTIKQILWAYRNRDKFAQLGQNGRVNAISKNVTTISTQWNNLFDKMMAQPTSLVGAKSIYATVV